MNTANLQLEGLLMAIAAVNRSLVQKGLLSHDEVEEALREAERTIEADRFSSIPSASLEAACFPIRLLRLANRSENDGTGQTFSALAKAIGEADQPTW